MFTNRDFIDKEALNKAILTVLQATRKADVKSEIAMIEAYGYEVRKNTYYYHGLYVVNPKSDYYVDLTGHWLYTAKDRKPTCVEKVNYVAILDKETKPVIMSAWSNKDRLQHYKYDVRCAERKINEIKASLEQKLKELERAYNDKSSAQATLNAFRKEVGLKERR